jgi:hypothetical protein
MLQHAIYLQTAPGWTAGARQLQCNVAKFSILTVHTLRSSAPTRLNGTNGLLVTHQQEGAVDSPNFLSHPLGQRSK